MKPRKFTAKSAREALAMVRAEIGPDAVILSNRKVADGVEVTAIDESDLDVLQGISAPAPVAATTPEMSTLNFQQYANERRQRRSEAPEPSAPSASGAVPEPTNRPTTESVRAAMPAPIDFLDQAPCADIAPAALPLRRRDAGQTASEMQDVVNELRMMRSFISQQFSALAWVDGVRRTPSQAYLLRRMLAAGFSPRLARAMVGSLPRDMDEAAADAWLAQALERNLRAACLDNDPFEQGGVFALVGPTGVGKTTSVAKIAAQYALRHGPQSVGLIGIDTYRVAGQDQLRRYGDLIGINVHIVHDVRGLVDTLAMLVDKRLVLIDTAGLGQRDPRVETLLENLSLSRVKRLLVVSASAQAEAIEETMTAYHASEAAGVLLTKVDEACLLGGALDALIRYRMPLVAVGNGQRVPEDWATPDPAEMVAQTLRHGVDDGSGLTDLDLTMLMQRVDLQTPVQRHGLLSEMPEGARHV